jgi:hypothetical protein
MTAPAPAPSSSRTRRTIFALQPVSTAYAPNPSSSRTRGSIFPPHWIPAFARMTVKGNSYGVPIYTTHRLRLATHQQQLFRPISPKGRTHASAA